LILMLAGAALAQATRADTALPALPAPVDVPMHIPKPPSDQGAVALRPQAPPTPAPAPRRPARPVASAKIGDTITPIAPQCRDARYRALIDGRPELVYARVCRMADGEWRLTR
jgi:hypothetical protein